MRSVRSIVIAAAGACAAPALAVDLGTIRLFDQTYRAQRFNYALVQWPDPVNAGFNLQLIEVEGAHWLGNDRLLLSTDAGDSQLSLKNWVIEVRLVRDVDGNITGLEYVRAVVINDFNPAYGGFDLSPCGVTINTGATGLSSGGNLLVGDSEANGVAGYDVTTGAQLGSFSGGTDNDSFDDLAYVPTNGLIYTINEDGEALVSFNTAGAFVASSPMPGLAVLDPLAIAGSPKGMAYLPDVATVPGAIRRPGGTLLVTLDDDNPGLQVFDLAGNVVATAALTDDPIVGGVSKLDQGAGCGNPLQLESCAFDAETGTIFLINEGSFTDCSGFYVLTPVCTSDFNLDGFSDAIDYDLFIAAWLASDPGSDINDDGFADAVDYDLFVASWLAGC